MKFQYGILTHRDYIYIKCLYIYEILFTLKNESKIMLLHSPYEVHEWNRAVVYQ